MLDEKITGLKFYVCLVSFSIFTLIGTILTEKISLIVFVLTVIIGIVFLINSLILITDWSINNDVTEYFVKICIVSCLIFVFVLIPLIVEDGVEVVSDSKKLFGILLALNAFWHLITAYLFGDWKGKKI